MMIELNLPYPVSGNQSARMYKGRMIQSKPAKSFKNAVGMIARVKVKSPFAGEVYAVYVLHPKANKDGKASKTRIDSDNSEKCTNDGMNGIVYLDDKQIEQKHWKVGAPVKNGGMTVYITDDYKLFVEKVLLMIDK